MSLVSLYDEASLWMTPGAYEDGKLLSELPTDGSGDFTFSRGSNLAATRVDANGLIEKGRENLLLQSNQFDTTWSLSSGSLTSGQSGYDGSNDAWLLTSVTSVRLQQGATLTGVQTFSIYAKAGTKSAFQFEFYGANYAIVQFDLSTGGTSISATYIDAAMEDVGGGWYRCIMVINGDYPIRRIGNFGAGNIYIQDAQLEQGMAATDYIETGASTAQAGVLEDEPRLDYSGGASCPSLLLEPSRTNIVSDSEYVTGYFSQVSALVTYNEIASPEGVQNAFKLTSTTDGQSRIEKSRSVGGTDTYTLSIFFKAGNSNYASLANFNRNASVRFNLADGTIQGSGNVVDADIIPIGSDGWYRCYMTMQETSGQTANIYKILVSSDGETYFANNGDYVYAYGAQLEQGSYPTSYIPTYGASQTRSFDNAGTRTDMQDFLGTDTGAWFMHFDEFYFDITGTGVGAIILAKDGQQATSIELVQDGNFQYKVTLNNSPAVENLDGEDKLLINWSGKFFKIFVNGVNVYSSSSSKWSHAFTHLILPETTRAPHIKIKQMLFFPTALNDSECIALTKLD